MRKLVSILLSIPFMALSCTEINNVVNPGDKPILEAYLAPDATVSMKVFTEIPYLEDDSAFSQAIEGLIITITSDEGTAFNLQDKGNGNYESIEKLGSAESNYSMSFQHNGRTISANTSLPPAPVNFQSDTLTIYRTELDLSGGFTGRPPGLGNGATNQSPLTLTWDNPDNVYHFIAAEYLESSLDPVVTFPTNTDGFTRPPQRFNNEPILGEVNNLQAQQFEYFGTYAIILYRLNPDYALLYENSGSTTQNIATPVSTISNGLGIFTGVNADTLYLEVKRLVE